ncbi:MAG: hypothetical protein LC104_21340, partial [Bacteroidales bacterium]|nr:hypothetical protein [Bacteroidales bacterium]
MIPLLWVAGLLAADPAPTIQLTPATADTGPRVVARLPPNVARALPKPAATLTLRVTPDSPAIFGETKLEQNQLTFTPRFPLTPGLTYRATLHLPGQESVTVSLTVPQPEPKPAATITHIYPTASTLPENTLRFYLCFSRPMTRGDAAKYISLLDADEQPVPAPFLHFEQELWSPDGTRFTLLFDPGRIKQELVPRQ